MHRLQRATDAEESETGLNSGHGQDAKKGRLHISCKHRLPPPLNPMLPSFSLAMKSYKQIVKVPRYPRSHKQVIEVGRYYKKQLGDIHAIGSTKITCQAELEVQLEFRGPNCSVWVGICRDTLTTRVPDTVYQTLSTKLGTGISIQSVLFLFLLCLSRAGMSVYAEFNTFATAEKVTRMSQSHHFIRMQRFILIKLEDLLYTDYLYKSL